MACNRVADRSPTAGALTKPVMTTQTEVHPQEVDVVAQSHLLRRPDVTASSVRIICGCCWVRYEGRKGAPPLGKVPTLGHEAEMHDFFHCPSRVCVR